MEAQLFTRALATTLASFAVAGPARAGDLDIRARQINDDVEIGVRTDTFDTPGWSAVLSSTLADGVLTMKVVEERRCTKRTIRTVDRTVITERTVESPRTLSKYWALGTAGVVVGSGLVASTAFTPQGFFATEPPGTRNGVPTGPAGSGGQTATADVFLAAGGGLLLVLGGRFGIAAATASLGARDFSDHRGAVDLVEGEHVEVCETRIPAGATVVLAPGLEGTVAADGVWSVTLASLNDTQVFATRGVTSLSVTDATVSTTAPLGEALARALATERMHRRMASFSPRERACHDAFLAVRNGEGVTEQAVFANPYKLVGRPTLWDLGASCADNAISATQYAMRYGCDDQYRWVANIPADLDLPGVGILDTGMAQVLVVGTISVASVQNALGANFDLPQIDVLCPTTTFDW